MHIRMCVCYVHKHKLRIIYTSYIHTYINIYICEIYHFDLANESLPLLSCIRAFSNFLLHPLQFLRNSAWFHNIFAAKSLRFHHLKHKQVFLDDPWWLLHDDSSDQSLFQPGWSTRRSHAQPLWFPDIFTKNELVCSRCEVAITHQDLHENANTKDSLHRFLNIEDAGVYEPTCEGSNRSNIWLCHIVPHFPASVLHIGIIRHGKYWLLSYLVAHPRNRGCFFLPPLNSVALG